MISLLIIFFVISIVASFLCSLWEAVLLSVTPTYAQIKIKEGTPIGKQLKIFKDNVDRPLAGILTLNTIAHTVGAIGVGVQAASLWQETHPFITAVAVPAIMTLAILILSEIIPKTLGATYWESFVPFTVFSLKIILFILAPLIWLSQGITRLLKKDRHASVFSRSEFLAMAEIGAEEGIIKKDESLIIANLLKFNSILVKDVMTPRTVVKAASQDQSVQEFFEDNKTLVFSRIPVYQDRSKDQIVGYVLMNRVLSEIISGKGSEQLSTLKREIIMVDESCPIPDLFTRFMEKREHIALVTDDFGGTAGIVTLEDIIETLLGMEIVDEFDGTVDMQSLARKKWEKRARALGLLDDVNEQTT